MLTNCETILASKIASVGVYSFLFLFIKNELEINVTKIFDNKKVTDDETLSLCISAQ